ncbi:MAG: monovalent cation/H(+) antiporter subunit G [Candidatus Omnitrophica bacterium]|nr:monovalent cation/H(+) antiporter subunit G [Candidatus Omnitrophota bacterium]MCM8788259.1 monovalent cation/H(+) antiporter subunit G [Candidatus Omnitrophota bacterium]
MNESVGFIFIVIGALFDLFGCIGLIRLPDLYNRLQAATKCVTLGTCGILLGAFIIFGFTAAGMKAFLCAVLVLITSPTSAHALARASYISGVKLWQGSVVDKLNQDIGKH